MDEKTKLLFDLDTFSTRYLYSCAGLYIDERELTITSHSGNSIFSIANGEKNKLFSFYRSYEYGHGSRIDHTDPSYHDSPGTRVGHVCPLYPKPNDFEYDWCISMVEQAMNRFYHMVVFALLLEAKRETKQIPGINISNITDNQMKFFFAEKLPLLSLAGSYLASRDKFLFIHTSKELKRQFQKKYNSNFINEVINVSKFIIGDEKFSFDGRIYTDQKSGELNSLELHADRIIHYCKLAIHLQPYLLEQYDYDNQAIKLRIYLKEINKFVEEAMKFCPNYSPNNTIFTGMQNIQIQYYYSIINFINMEIEKVQTSLYLFYKLSNDHPSDLHPVKSDQSGQPPINNQVQPQLWPPMLQAPFPQPASQDYLLLNDPVRQQQVYAQNFPIPQRINSQMFLPNFSPIEQTNKIQSLRKVWEILNGLDNGVVYQSGVPLNCMPYPKSNEYDKKVLLQNRAEFELLKRVYDPEECHRLHLDLTIVVYDSIHKCGRELSVKNFVNAGLPMEPIELQRPEYDNIKIDINQIAQQLGLKIPLPLLFIYSAIHKKNPLQSATEILQMTKTSTDFDDLMKCSPVNEKGDFSEAIEPFVIPDCSIINFMGENASTYYSVVQGRGNWGYDNFYSEMPLVYISKIGEQYHKPLLLPPKTHRLYGIDNLLKNRNVFTFLTEHLEIAYRYTYLFDANFLSWWGGSHTVDKVDFSPLDGKTVYYILFDQWLMQTALKVCRRIKEVNGHPHIVYCERSFQPENNHFSNLNVIENDIYNDELFGVLADRINYQGDMFDFKDAPKSDDSKKVDLVKGIIKSNQFIVVYGKEKSGKTYVSLSLSLGIACKKDPHELWQIDNEINAGVMYCHGEMDDNDIKERIDFLKNKMGIEETDINFESINLRDVKFDNDNGQSQLFNLTEEKCQTYLRNRVKKFQKEHKNISQTVIVLDNYACLMGTGSQQADMFNPAYSLIADLQEKYHCCVILVCHDNQQGAIASSRQIVRKVDGVIKVSRVAEWKVEIRKSFFNKANVKNLLDFETISEELKKEFVTKKEVIVSHIEYQNFRNIENLEPFSMTLQFNDEFDNPYAWEVEISDKEQYINDLVALYAEAAALKKSTASRKGLHSRKNENPEEERIGYDKLRTMTSDEIKEVIVDVWNQIELDYPVAKNGKVPILKAMANYFSVSEPTFRNLGKEKGFVEGFTSETLFNIVKKHLPDVET